MTQEAILVGKTLEITLPLSAGILGAMTITFPGTGPQVGTDPGNQTIGGVVYQFRVFPAAAALATGAYSLPVTFVLNGQAITTTLGLTVALNAGITPSPSDYPTIRDLAGVDADDWSDARIEEDPFLPLALTEAARRVPCDWAVLDTVSQGYLHLGLLYETAARIVPAANPARSDDFKIGDFSLKNDSASLLADTAALMGYANQYYAQVVLPAGIVAVPERDAFPRRVAGKARTVGYGRFW